MKKTMTVKDISSAIQRCIEREKASQATIAMKLGMNQGQLSRIARGKFKRLSPQVRKLCNYAQLDVDSIASEQKQRISKKLCTVIEEVWDGSPRHEQALARVIKSLQHL